jgi:hypothetical protein
MKKLITISLMLIALFLIVANVTASPLPDSDDIEVEGLVESFTNGTIVVDGVTFIIEPETIIITGRGRGNNSTVSELAIGVWVSVSGFTDESGNVIANKIRIKPWENPNSDSDTVPEDDDDNIFKPKHPVALWIAERYKLDYGALMDMHEAGIGWGKLVKAYQIADQITRANPATEVLVNELLDMRLEGKGWGKITRESGTYPGTAPPAWGRDKDREHPNPNAGPKK